MAKDGLRKLGRTELLQLLLEAEEENERLKQQVTGLEEQLADRSIRVEKCGDLAKASLELNGVFSAAQKACEQYAENIKSRNAGIESRCRELEQETMRKCQQMEQDTEKRCREMENETAEKCREILEELTAKYNQYFGAIGDTVDSRLGNQDKE